MKLEPADERYLALLRDCLTGSIYDESGYAPLVDSFRWTINLKRLARGLLLGWLARRDLALYKVQPFDREKRESGRDWPAFGYTMVGTRRLQHLRQCLEDVIASRVPGDVLEAGVWRGGASIFMHAVLRAHGVTDRRIWLADSFAGLPRPTLDQDRHDHHYDVSGIGYLAVSLEQVKANFERFGLLGEQVRFLEGWFRDTLPAAPVERLALLRADGDLYESTMDTLVPLYDRVSPGGYVVIDDYHVWQPARDAVHDFRKRRGIESPIQEIDGSGVFWRV